MFADPPPSAYDVHFSIFGIPVRVHPFFWLVAVLLGLSAPSMRGVFVWIAALFIAILVHELGHALVMRYFGLQPWITLHGFGGLAAYDTSQLAYSRANTWIRQILISAAGAGAGFLLAITLIAIFLALGHQVAILVGVGDGHVFNYSFKTGLTTWIIPGVDYTGFQISIPDINSEFFGQFIFDILQVCVLWGLVNLLPIYPLDGGHISRDIFLRFDAHRGIRRSLILSTVTAALLAAFVLVNMFREARAVAEQGGESGSPFGGASLFIALFFGYLAYSSFSTLQAYDQNRPRW